MRTGTWFWLLTGTWLAFLTMAELGLRRRHRHLEEMAARLEGRPDPEEVLAADYRLVALGDSITYGYGVPAQAAYPAILARRLARAMPDRSVAVVNSGVNGQTAVMGLARLERDVLLYRPHVVLIAFGLNDAHLNRSVWDERREWELWSDRWPFLPRLHLFRTLNARGQRLARRLKPWSPPPVSQEPWLAPRLSPAGFVQALTRLTQRIRREAGAAVYLLTTTPVTLWGSESDGWRERQILLCEHYNVLIREVATKQGVGLIDVAAAFIDQNLPLLLADDGLHLTVAGQEFLAATVFAVLKRDGWLKGAGHGQKQPEMDYW